MKMGARYLVRVENSRKLPITDYSRVRQSYGRMLADFGCRLNSSRISSVAVELDFFAPDRRKAEEMVELLRSQVRVLSTSDLLANEAVEGKEKTLEEAKRLFNEERFWEVHEKVEGIWRTASGEEKQVQQSIILYAGALVHYQKNEMETTLRMLKRSLEKMKWSADSYFCFDLSRMRREAEGMIGRGSVSVFRL